MLINGDALYSYLGSLIYPIDIFHANSGQVATRASAEELVTLVAAGMVFGIGSRRRLRRLQLHERPIPQHNKQQQRQGDGQQGSSVDAFTGWRAETNFTIQRQQLSCGVIFRHHPRHCAAFHPQALVEDPMLSAGCL